MGMTLKAEARSLSTKSEIKKLRESGKIPGSVYGKKIGSSSIAVDAKELLTLLRSNPHAIVSLDIPNEGVQPVMIQDVQRDKLSRSLLHIDFHQINMNEPVRTMVAVELTGEPQGVKTGGILQVQMHEVEIRGLPDLIPGAITFDVSGLEMGDLLHAGDLPMPEGIELKSAPDDVVATILVPQKEESDQTEPVAPENRGKADLEPASPV
ncbi:50S ribosomal protein L25 [Paenibacillus sp. MBLB4367]|uniref:50S ribosomal protein L25 n=1 Tax=Paenibacillus sp. MBLB4367 TaxID=3384767 RepID=UPI003907F78B